MESNEGYINIVSVMQKFFDQAIMVTGHTIQRSLMIMKSCSVMANDLSNNI